MVQTLDNFQDDEKTTDAVVRNFEIIGEAAGRLLKDFINRHLHLTKNNSSKNKWSNSLRFCKQASNQYRGFKRAENK